MKKAVLLDGLFISESDNSIFVLFSLIVVAECVGFAKTIENSCYEIGALLTNVADPCPTLLEPRPEIQRVLPCASTRLIVRRSGHPIKLHHNLHSIPPLCTPLTLTSFAPWNGIAIVSTILTSQSGGGNMLVTAGDHPPGLRAYGPLRRLIR